jgi:hypothetical protein
MLLQRSLTSRSSSGMIMWLAHTSHCKRGHSSFSAGQSVVAITSNNGLNVFNASWVSNVACAIKILFPCTTYSTTFNDDDGRCYSITHTFYGLAEQSAVAAQAFEMVYNLILTWAALNKAAKGKDGKRCGNGTSARQMTELIMP